MKPERGNGGIRIAADVGGTFTDVVTFDPSTGDLQFGKTLTTPAHLIDGTADAVTRAGADIATCDVFLHGTTIVINTILERSGAKAALVTTKGFRDVYEIGRINRPESYNLFFRKHVPLIPRSRCFELDERMNGRGEVVKPILPADLAELAETIRREKMEAVAILFLHSYANPAHELAAKAAIESACPGVFVTTSHEISQEYREFERTSTIAANAYVGPRVQTYLDEFQSRLEADGFGGSFYIVQSNGGLCDAPSARRECIKLLESGPAAGVIGALTICNRLALPGAIAFDMGGTTAKAGVVQDGAVMMAGSIMVGGYVQGLPVQIPLVDIQEVGTGGGSIARVGAGGLRVGPESAGAAPGPACYDRGGVEPTVTDANLILGRLDPERFLGGEMKLSLAKAREAIEQHVAGPLGLDVYEAANGIIRIAATTMSNVVTRVTTERGLDASDFAMIAYGGAGPLHSGLVARELMIPIVIIPPSPGHACAFGMLTTDLKRDFVRTWFCPLDAADPKQLEAIFETLRATGESAVSAGAAKSELACTRGADMRYVGQEHAVTVAFPPRFEPGLELATIKTLFDAAHARRYGFDAPAERAEIVSLHLSAIRVLPKPPIRTIARAGVEIQPECESRRQVYFTEFGTMRSTAVYSRSALRAGHRIEGPALIEEYASTTVVFPGDIVDVSRFGDLMISIARN